MVEVLAIPDNYEFCAYYAFLAKALPGLVFDSASTILTVLGTLGLAIAVLLNKRVGVRIMNPDWVGISRWWSVPPLVLLVIVGLMKANHQEFKTQADLAMSRKQNIESRDDEINTLKSANTKLASEKSTLERDNQALRDKLADARAADRPINVVVAPEKKALATLAVVFFVQPSNWSTSPLSIPTTDGKVRFSLMIKNTSEEVAHRNQLHLTLLDEAMFASAPPGFQTPNPASGETRFATLRDPLSPDMYTGALDFEVTPSPGSPAFRIETTLRCDSCGPNPMVRILTVRPIWP